MEESTTQKEYPVHNLDDGSINMYEGTKTIKFVADEQRKRVQGNKTRLRLMCDWREIDFNSEQIQVLTLSQYVGEFQPLAEEVVFYSVEVRDEQNLEGELKQAYLQLQSQFSHCQFGGGQGQYENTGDIKPTYVTHSIGSAQKKQFYEENHGNEVDESKKFLPKVDFCTDSPQKIAQYLHKLEQEQDPVKKLKMATYTIRKINQDAKRNGYSGVEPISLTSHNKGQVTQKPTGRSSKKHSSKDGAKYSTTDYRFITHSIWTTIKVTALQAFYGDKKYLAPRQDEPSFGKIEAPIPKGAKIGIFGDWGSGQKDAVDMIRYMVLEKKVDILIHLGDVYYTGQSQEYERNVIEPLRALRWEVQQKEPDRKVRYYALAGNHDYYSYDFNFMNHLEKSQPDPEFSKDYKQRASFFCLRTEDGLLQFLASDTGRYDIHISEVVRTTSTGQDIYHKEAEWQKQRIEEFKGTTVFLTHHMAFSKRQKINGKASAYKKYDYMNVKLISKMFTHLPYISYWMWGHEHAVMFYKPFLFGIPKGRLLGNGAYREYGSSRPYGQMASEIIPLIEPDNKYFQKYIPLLDKEYKQAQDDYLYDFTYAYIDTAQAQKGKDFTIQYWNAPCYTQDQQKDFAQFAGFPKSCMYEEKIWSKEKLEAYYAKNPIRCDQKLYLTSQIGVPLIQTDSKPSFKLKQLASQIRLEEKSGRKQLKQGDEVYVQFPHGYLAVSQDGSVVQSKDKNDRSLWKIEYPQIYQSRNNSELLEYQAFRLLNQGKTYLSVNINKPEQGIFLKSSQEWQKQDKVLKQLISQENPRQIDEPYGFLWSLSRRTPVYAGDALNLD